MNTFVVVLLTLGIGVIAGLRTVTAPAVVAWAARLGWLSLAGTPVAFMGSTLAVVIFTAGVLVETIVDELPGTPARTVPTQFAARVVSGAFSGACLALAAGRTGWLGVILGGLGAIAGTLGGYNARVGLVRRLHVPDRAIAIPEDVIAIGTGLLLVSRF
jgi:uncharacterized membrane protein